ncbi:arylamine N-acetyltransferase [Acinetobacter guerrae]|uniref:Arylamine N-acetyltransferase n=1 Tax=Acinetobacter guerrae TaxID=1843371 RepID=A0A3A8EFJ3_9GAMM|nr:arylamine N-acetyltransferase [Acinetobacter guerrae]RKG33345.1 arylamine N-acetyltransferase [Acinetobacter guerrae]
MNPDDRISKLYLNKLGFSENLRPNLDHLKLIFSRHIEHLPFGNLNSFLGDKVSIDVNDIAQKLLVEGREGYCLEQNLLTSLVLNELGYNACNLLARVYYQQNPLEAPIRTHLVTVVKFQNDQLFLFDPGFGGMTPAQVLSLNLVGETQLTPLEPYRIIPVKESGIVAEALIGMQYMVQAFVRNEWINIYALNPEQSVAQSDIMIANWFISTSPDSLFTQDLIFSIVDEDNRLNFRNGKLMVYGKNGNSKQQFTTVEEIRDCLKTKFKLNVDGMNFHKLMVKLEKLGLQKA